jgi:exodeoxyribonuclease V alpha subunit
LKKRWPFLWKFVAQGSLLTLDCALAEEAETAAEAAVLALLLAFYRMGHLCLKVEAEQILPSLKVLNIHSAELEEQVRSMPTSALFVREENRFYLPKPWQIEQEFIAETLRLVSGDPKPPLPNPLPTSLTAEQQQAVAKALQHPLSLIAGGPGTGKSFTAAAIANAFAAQKRDAILLAAPTGKAAASLEKKLPGMQAMTLHRLLQVSSFEDFQEPPPWIYMDLLIVDECSMIDPALFARLMRAVRGKTHLVLLGDPYQLPAVEGGSLFADLLFSQVAPSTELTLSVRFEKSALMAVAEGILSGDIARIQLEPFPDEEQIWQAVRAHFPAPSNAPNEDLSLLHRFALLTPLRRGPFGVEALGKRLFSRFQQLGVYGQYLSIPILVTKSDKQLKLCNGQMGLLIHRIGRSEEDYALFEGGERFARKHLPPFEYAYALSVHKSQGSEYEEVLLLIPEGAEAFGRELLYTGATRARKKLMIHGEKEKVALLLQQVSGKVSGVREKLACLEPISKFNAADF